ncbi:hypothetical protein LCGC14_2906740 [marine sediment metagenome]|uniref:HTH cro/C1-type domain-containing protein n=1 Tax=marine sediment metagenome TaxID=412755 RepID=A0A0F9A0K3_9ZZZZ
MIPPDYTSLPARFWDRVEVDEKTGCWVFIGSGTSQGYVKFTEDYQHIYAHRLAAADYYGPIPEGMLALHHCDNPPCVYYEHLYIGSRQDNMDDMKRRGRSMVGERSGNAKLTDHQASEIIQLCASKRYTQKEVARRYGVHTTAVNKIVNGHAWKHVQ